MNFISFFGEFIVSAVIALLVLKYIVLNNNTHEESRKYHFWKSIKWAAKSDEKLLKYGITIGSFAFIIACYLLRSTGVITGIVYMMYVGGFLSSCKYRR